MDNSFDNTIKVPDAILNTLYNGVTYGTIQTIKGFSERTAYRHLVKIRDAKGKLYISLEDMATFYGQTLKEMIDEFYLMSNIRR